MLKMMWIDTCYRFRCSFSNNKQKIDASADRWLTECDKWISKQMPGLKLVKLWSWIIYYILIPVWKIRGYKKLY